MSDETPTLNRMKQLRPRTSAKPPRPTSPTAQATAEEASAADRSRDKFAADARDVAENEESMAKRGAERKG